MKNELSILLKTITSAGNAIELLRKKGVSTTLKPNQSPLTEADLLANDILRKNLLANFPNDGWLSEETIDDQTRLQKQRVWIVDPIDGTKEFIKNIPEYALSVALVENGVPKVSAVFNPATQELFYAMQGQGAWLNGQPIQANYAATAPLHILVSRTEFSEGKWDKLKNQNALKATGSIAYKLALIAKGAAHGTVSLVLKNEWDIAAGVLLVQEASGKITDIEGNDLLFNQENLAINGIIASSKTNYEYLYNMIQLHSI